LPLSAKIAEIRDHNIDPLDYMGEDYVRKEEREKIREIEKRRTIDRERERKRMNMWTKKRNVTRKYFLHTQCRTIRPGVARFFLVQHTKTWENKPNDHKIGMFGLKRYHLATLIRPRVAEKN
jgi:hypothetical protein